MKCRAHVSTGRYAKPGPCENRGAKKVRWAPTPLTTRVVPLCIPHKNKLERGGQLVLVDGTRL